MRKLGIKGYLEQDGLTGWRRVLCYMDKPGQAKKAKRRHNRRVRRDARKDIEEQRE